MGHQAVGEGVCRAARRMWGSGLIHCELRPNDQINVWEDDSSGALVANGETPEALLGILTALVEKG